MREQTLEKRNISREAISTVRPERSQSNLERFASSLGRFYRNIKNVHRLRESREIRQIPEFAQDTAIVNYTSDAAREIVAELSQPEMVGIKEQTEKQPLESKVGRKLEAGQSILETENPYQYMAMVRVSNNAPVLENGKLMIRTAMQETDGKVPRPTLHFTVNCRVGNNDGGNWDNVDFAYVIPADKAVEKNGKPYALGKEDTYWATVKGFELPEGTKIIYNKNKENDPVFQQFLQDCRNSQASVEFIASQGQDQSQIDTSLAEMGYADIPNFTDSEEDLAKKVGVKRGGYGSHTGSPIWAMEKTFIHGMPGFKTEKRSRGNTAAHTPFDQLRSLSKLKGELPNDVYHSFEDLALNHLAYLLEDKSRIQDFAKARVEGPGGYNDEREFIQGIYQGIVEVSSRSEKSLHLREAVLGHPELIAAAEKMVIESAASPEFFEVAYQILMGETEVSEDLKKQIVKKAVE